MENAFLTAMKNRGSFEFSDANDLMQRLNRVAADCCNECATCGADGNPRVLIATYEGYSWTECTVCLKKTKPAPGIEFDMDLPMPMTLARYSRTLQESLNQTVNEWNLLNPTIRV